MLHQPYKFDTGLNGRFIDHMLIMAISDVKLFDKSKQDAFHAEFKRRSAADLPHDIVFTVDGHDLPIVDAFERLKDSLEDSYYDDVRKAAKELLRDRLGALVNKIEELDRLVDDGLAEAECKIFGDRK